MAHLQRDGFHIGERIGEADGTAEHGVESYGGSQDDDRKSSHQLEEDPVSHFFLTLTTSLLLSSHISYRLFISLTLGPRSGSRHRARF